jgi:hypothetical protein
MKRNVLIFGITLGTILAGNMVYMVSRLFDDVDMETNEVVGYAAMVVVFSLSFFGIRNYRNKELNGFISFGEAFKTGALITFIGSSMYVGVWLIYYYLFAPDFIDQYSLHVLHDAARNGVSDSELAAKTKEMADFKEMYKNPLFVVLISYAEVLPVGLVVALISALSLKRKPAAAVSEVN